MAQHGGDNGVPDTHEKMRQYLCMAFTHLTEIHHKVENVEEYHNKMSTLGEPGDDIILLTAATVFKRRIIVYPIFPNPHPFIHYNPIGGEIPTKPDFHLLHFSDTYFTRSVYKSIIRDSQSRLSLPGESDPKSSTMNGISGIEPLDQSDIKAPPKWQEPDLSVDDSNKEQLTTQRRRRRHRKRNRKSKEKKEAHSSN